MGMQIRTRAFVSLIKGYAVALVGLGEKERIEARESTLREIFSTFDSGKAEKILSSSATGATRTYICLARSAAPLFAI